MGAGYDEAVRIIARSTLSGFVRNRVEPRLQRVVQEHLNAWHALACRANWKNSAELKAQSRTASIVSSNRAVFNIKGNEFRLVVGVNYIRGFVFIVWIGTHREYDRIDVKTVPFNKERYADSSDSN